MKGSCPKCGSSRVTREHSRNGFTNCLKCGLRLPHKSWKNFSLKLGTLQKQKTIELEQTPLSEQEAYVVAKRRDELWNRLDRFGNNLTGDDTIKNVRNTILNYISELEARKEIPKGLTVERVEPNLKRYSSGPWKGQLMFPGHLVVKFGLTSDCKHKEELLPFLGGNKCLL